MKINTEKQKVLVEIKKQILDYEIIRLEIKLDFNMNF